jgi:beta-fructofuranosidase
MTQTLQTLLDVGLAQSLSTKGLSIASTRASTHKSPYPQTICHATSDDLIHWRKDPSNPIIVPDERWYEPQDWRDPFVFFNPEAGEFWMLICARDKRIAFERRGCVALATSKDLQNWQVREPLWSGSICWAAECPDMFRLGNHWYLVYSHGTTRYRWSEKLNGVWFASFPDTFDTEFVAAAKTLFDGGRQILFGWIGTLEGESDFGHRQWGGHMALPRELVPQPDGSLSGKAARRVCQVASGERITAATERLRTVVRGLGN